MRSPKLIPWFVSDVTPADFLSTIPSLLSESFFSSASDAPSVTSDDHAALREMVTRWQSYLDTGAFALSVPPETPLGGKTDVNNKVEFWTGPWPYWELQAKAPVLFKDLQSSQLVIFKARKSNCFDERKITDFLCPNNRATSSTQF